MTEDALVAGMAVVIDKAAVAYKSVAVGKAGTARNAAA